MVLNVELRKPSREVESADPKRNASFNLLVVIKKY
jgi:hypothetical protein